MTDINNTKIKYVLLLEAIRAGIPSRELVGELPDLRQELVSMIDADLEKLSGGQQVKGRIIWGEYGHGKTHFLKLIEKHILAQGYAVSYLTLNRDLGLNNLGNLYPALSSHVLTRDANIPGLLNQLIHARISSSGRQELFTAAQIISHPLPLHVFKGMQNFEPREMIMYYNALMGKKENITWAKKQIKADDKHEYSRMVKFVQKDHLISFMEFFPLLLKSMGHQGWVILIDELEMMGRMGKVSRLNSYRNLSWLMNLSLEHKLPIYTIAASAKALQDDVWYGQKKYDATDMPKYAEERYDIQTSARIHKFFEQASGKQGLVLKPVKAKDLYPLLERLLDIHRAAIGWKYDLPDDFVNNALKHIDPSNKPIRQIIRMFIEIMDIYATRGIIPGRFLENVVVDYDYEDELPDRPEDDDNGQVGFRETAIKEMFEPR
jgi:hypothetical protein